MSMRSSRTLTLSPAADSRYSSSLSWTPVGSSAAKAASAGPNRRPKVRHSQRGLMVSMPGSFQLPRQPLRQRREC